MRSIGLLFYRKMIFLLSFLLFLFIGSSCSVDYDPGETFIEEKNYLVVNSILNPLNPVEIRFYSTVKTDSGYRFRPEKNVHILLKENGSILFDGICTDTALHLNYFPQVGAGYSIEAYTDEFEKVNASTTVPDSITGSVRINLADYYEGWTGDIVSVSDFQFPKGEISMWITAYWIQSNNKVFQYNELYANNMLADKVNRMEGSMVKNEIVGSGYHDAFLRIKNKNLHQLTDLVFTPAVVHVWGTEKPDFQLHTTDQVKIITASKEYDQYNRTLYEQKAMIVFDDDISSVLYQPVTVYSNVINGLGIFAGMSESNHYYEIPKEP